MRFTRRRGTARGSSAAAAGSRTKRASAHTRPRRRSPAEAVTARPSEPAHEAQFVPSPVVAVELRVGLPDLVRHREPGAEPLDRPGAVERRELQPQGAVLARGAAPNVRPRPGPVAGPGGDDRDVLDKAPDPGSSTGPASRSRRCATAGSRSVSRTGACRMSLPDTGRGLPASLRRVGHIDGYVHAVAIRQGVSRSRPGVHVSGGKLARRQAIARPWRRAGARSRRPRH